MAASAAERSREVNRYIKSHCSSCDVQTSPASFVSPETGQLRNSSLSFHDSEAGVKLDLFSENWYHGVSLSEIDAVVASDLLQDRPSLLRKLRGAVSCYASDMERDIGPRLECDDNDRDLEDHAWTAGLDCASSCAGLYSADCVSQAFDCGIHRNRTRFFLVVKAGPGRAARDFHMSYQASLRAHAQFNDALATGIGPQSLRRIEMSAKRNRTRIVADMASALGIPGVPTTPDHASHAAHPQFRCAIPTIDVHTNFLKRIADKKRWLYSAGMVDGGTTGGIVTCSNTAGGIRLFAERNGSLEAHVKNEFGNLAPFGSVRTLSSLQALLKIGSAVTASSPHEDDRWVRERFTWTHPTNSDLDLVPMSLWGMHHEEEHVQEHSVALGLSKLRMLTCNPEAVVVPGLESPHLLSIGQCRE